MSSVASSISQLGNGVSTKAEEAPLLGAVTKQQLGKTTKD
jgi:hypothetical protein